MSNEEQQRGSNARLRELLSIPERMRTDAQWDEIIEIEISQGPRKSSSNISKSPGKSPNQSPNQGAPRQTDRKPSGMGKHMRKRRPPPPSST